MEISEVKSNLNQIILYSDSEMKNVEYLFTACILRKNKKNEFVYSAEIQDLHNKNSILICDLGRLKALRQKRRPTTSRNINNRSYGGKI